MWVRDENIPPVQEDRAGRLDADAMLALVGVSLLRVPLEPSSSGEPVYMRCVYEGKPVSWTGASSCEASGLAVWLSRGRWGRGQPGGTSCPWGVSGFARDVANLSRVGIGASNARVQVHLRRYRFFR